MQGKIGRNETTAIQIKAHEVLMEAFGDMVVVLGKATYYSE